MDLLTAFECGRKDNENEQTRDALWWEREKACEKAESLNKPMSQHSV
jgi:hypothetical protein